MKRFNVTGTCIDTEHYMADISAKLDEIEKLVDNRRYFTINRARQYGKTTTLYYLEKRLVERGDYIVARISFENIDVDVFESAETFCRMFLNKISKALRFYDADYAKKWLDPNVTDLRTLDEHIANMCEDKKIVLMIDEVDKSSNNRLFLHFLGLLRDKFLMRQTGKDFTFHSVILAGVTDIKNLKLKMINDGTHTPLKDEGKIINSPWNIAANFNVDMSFNTDEITAMLFEYENDNKTGMNITEVVNEIYKYTNGYPFLVSRICQCIDEELNKNWTTDGVNQAVRIILTEKNTLFDDIVKNLENNLELQNFIYELFIEGKHKLFTYANLTTDLAITYGYIKRGDRGAVISNRIFEAFIAEYFMSKREYNGKRDPGVIYQDVIKNGKFDMAYCLIKFAEHYKEIYTDKEEYFFERHGRLLFMSYLTPLLNGQGFIHIESQLTDQRRMDLVVDFKKEQFIIELKLWRGDAAKENAYEQLLGYMNTKNANEGYLLTFDFRKNKRGEYNARWVDVGGKRVFDVVV